MKTPPLRTALLFLIFNSSFLICKAQWVTIPDYRFRNYLQNNFPSCMSGTMMDTTCPAIINAVSVRCFNYQIDDLTGIQYFDNLDTLIDNVSNLDFIPAFPPGLVYLNVDYNQLDSLPPLPPTLTYLDCGRNYGIKRLPTLPISLKYLDCAEDDLDSLPALPPGLTYLECYNNDIRILPALPDSLTQLKANNNLLDSLPALPAGLVRLECGGNALISLPSLPSGLFYLTVSFNQLTSLPALPNGIAYFGCNNNQLTSLPALPDSLIMLTANNNQLTSLPALPAKLNFLSVNDNLLTSIPELPDILSSCSLHNNPINCLPRLKRITTLNFTGTNITCLPNYGSVTTSYPPLNTVPICDIFNANGCEILWNISGQVYNDVNGNCVPDSNETGVINAKIQLWRNGNLIESMSTVGSGTYAFDTDSFGIYSISIDTAFFPFDITCPAGNVVLDTIVINDTLHWNKNFAIECRPGFDLAVRSISALRFRPVQITAVNIHLGNSIDFYEVNCNGSISGNVKVEISGPVSYVSPAPGALAPDSVNGNILTYNIADFATTDFDSSFNIMIQTNSTAPLGSQVCFNVSVTPTVGDYDTANNTLTHCFTVVGSFDPNDKQVYPLADIDTAQEWLTYTVRFQNTGTAEAQHIYITDTLDSDLDVSSLQLLAYSHQPMVQLKENAVRFNFPNINLPDSNTNEPLSHGYVQYKIKLKDNLPIGTQINNTAFIYFDFNAAVVTNTTTNTITVISGIQSAIDNPQFEMFPNPASDAVTISVDEEMIGRTATVTDITGRKMAAVHLEARSSKLEAQNFGNGVYFVAVMDKEGRSTTKKLVIQK